jgi:ACR3 family arsenite efflux pump ArsB
MLVKGIFIYDAYLVHPYGHFRNCMEQVLVSEMQGRDKIQYVSYWWMATRLVLRRGKLLMVVKVFIEQNKKVVRIVTTFIYFIPILIYYFTCNKSNFPAKKIFQLPFSFKISSSSYLRSSSFPPSA